jgi:hypothetical protein
VPFFQKIPYKFPAYNIPQISVRLPLMLQEALSKSLPNLWIHYCFGKAPRLPGPRLLLKISSRNLVTLKLLPLEESRPISWHNYWTLQFERKICAAPNLETFHIPARYHFYPKNRESGRARPRKMFPPIQALWLEVDWPYGVNDVRRIWDFTNYQC